MTESPKDNDSLFIPVNPVDRDEPGEILSGPLEINISCVDASRYWEELGLNQVAYPHILLLASHIKQADAEHAENCPIHSRDTVDQAINGALLPAAEGAILSWHEREG